MLGRGALIPVTCLREIAETFERRCDDILRRGGTRESFGGDCPPVFEYESRRFACQELKST